MDPGVARTDEMTAMVGRMIVAVERGADVDGVSVPDGRCRRTALGGIRAPLRSAGRCVPPAACRRCGERGEGVRTVLGTAKPRSA